ncbi:hypothetical protein PG984_016471 [Apiospora sp. TS-2023a]
MKYTTIAAALLPLASAASGLDGLKYQIDNFNASCSPASIYSEGVIYCWYDLSPTASNNPDFGQSCSVMGTSDNGDLPAVDEMQCGTFRAAVAKSDDGGLVFSVGHRMNRRTGSIVISPKDLVRHFEPADGDEHLRDQTLQSYTGDKSFTINADRVYVEPKPSSSTATQHATMVTAVPSSTESSSSSTTAASSEPSPTGPSQASPTATNGGTRGVVPAGVLCAGLLAFIF